MRVFTVTIEFPYLADQEARKAERERIIQGLEDIGVNVKHIRAHGYIEFSQDFMLTETQLVDITIWGISFKIKMQADVGVGNAELVHRISAITARLDQVAGGFAGGSSDSMLNQKCNQHVPGNLLSHYNETLLLEDVCTDYLQESLDKGWRIIAACPQPDGRRPDYILGRYNISHELNKGSWREHS